MKGRGIRTCLSRQTFSSLVMPKQATLTHLHCPFRKALQFEKQSQDMDRFIRLQNEKLRIMLQDQRKQQVATLLKKVESNAIYTLRHRKMKTVPVGRSLMRRRTRRKWNLCQINEERESVKI
ncbi:uncharacterized protein LOC129302639 [Prosopis cineraria]|uniref:uncharacterized protein LOC129302639 n=1 Tax=Prosopis cineraria TaxID=364024 RepID=UPI0024103F11|nr:uncharacterized protein LOC129302639 [Prosopis cineraria]